MQDPCLAQRIGFQQCSRTQNLLNEIEYQGEEFAQQARTAGTLLSYEQTRMLRVISLRVR